MKGDEQALSPGGTAEAELASRTEDDSIVPLGLFHELTPSVPAMNRGAILGCPCGTHLLNSRQCSKHRETQTGSFEKATFRMETVTFLTL